MFTTSKVKDPCTPVISKTVQMADLELQGTYSMNIYGMIVFEEVSSRIKLMNDTLTIPEYFLLVPSP